MLPINEFVWSMQDAVKFHHDQNCKDPVRRWDKMTPYAMHPIWCAMTLLSETKLPQEIRDIGYTALCFHDIPEDTLAEIPEWVHPKSKEYIQEMTFTSSEEEFVKLWERSDECKLFKLYDKTSNLMDGSWMPNEKWNRYCDHVYKLIEFVEGKFGDLNIVKIARAVAIRR